MKSTHSPSRRISSSEGGFHRQSRFHPPEVWISLLCCAKACAFAIAAEQKARTTYDNILRLTDDPDVREPIKFLRAREIVHYQRFAEALGIAQEKSNCKTNYYITNPSFDTNCAPECPSPLRYVDSQTTRVGETHTKNNTPTSYQRYGRTSNKRSF